jgi:uncharacterized protein with HEPN domain
MLKDDGYVLDMLIAARLLHRFTEGEDWDTFSADEKLQSAVRYQEQVLGEAANHVSEAYRRLHRQIPWERLVGMRHRLVHGYREIEALRVWRLIEHDLDRLLRELENLVPPDDEAKDSE